MKYTPAIVLGMAAALAAGSALASGEEIYKEACASCHDNGIAGAPKVGDKAAWADRIKLGMDTLYHIGLNGKPGTAMLAKGGYASLDEAEVKSAVDYMVEKSK